MATLTLAVDVPLEVEVEEPLRRPGLLGRCARAIVWLFRTIGSGIEWLFGVLVIVLGLSVLAALPVAQFLSLGYFLESSARVARSGRLREGLIGVRRAARIGGAVLGMGISLLPVTLIGSFARSAALIDPGGRIAAGWRIALAVTFGLTLAHLALAFVCGGRLRHFLWPIGNPFRLRRRSSRNNLYVETRDAFWAFVGSLRLPYYFRVGLVGFVGTLVWLAPAAFLISLGGRFPLLGIIGTLLLALIVSFVPFLQVHYAVEGRPQALFDRRAIASRFRCAPWAFAFALFVLLLASIPLYLLKIEMIPREAAWLPCLVFVIFLAPARLLTGWAYARSIRRERPRHWLFRILGRLAIIPAALFYVLIVFVAQYTSWGGAWSLYEQHAFLLPVPFLGM